MLSKYDDLLKDFGNMFTSTYTKTVYDTEERLWTSLLIAVMKCSRGEGLTTTQHCERADLLLAEIRKRYPLEKKKK